MGLQRGPRGDGVPDGWISISLICTSTLKKLNLIHFLYNAMQYACYDIRIFFVRKCNLKSLRG